MAYTNGRRTSRERDLSDTFNVIDVIFHLSMIYPRLADQHASSFLSNMIGNQIKQNLDDVNSDKMTDSLKNDRMKKNKEAAIPLYCSMFQSLPAYIKKKPFLCMCTSITSTLSCASKLRERLAEYRFSSVSS